MQRVFGYVKYIIGFGIQYEGEQIYLDLNYFIIDYNIIGYADIFKKEDIQAIADADYTLDLVDPKSICRYIFTILRKAICFSSTK